MLFMSVGRFEITREAILKVYLFPSFAWFSLTDFERWLTLFLCVYVYASVYTY